MVAITAFYAGFLALLYIALAVRVIGARQSKGVSLSDGDDVELRRRIRAHGNAAENIPLGIVLLALLELQTAPTVLLHVFGVTLLVGRLLHGMAL